MEGRQSFPYLLNAMWCRNK